MPFSLCNPFGYKKYMNISNLDIFMCILPMNNKKIILKIMLLALVQGNFTKWGTIKFEDMPPPKETQVSYKRCIKEQMEDIVLANITYQIVKY